ncbi:MAG TPA: DUF6544 family protein [Gemmatimonadaceae bacterium]|nr:DUF6544 family protein [Gemmatimonadaceae bacterium]
MRSWIRLTGLLMGGAATAAAATIGVAGALWNRETAWTVFRLDRELATQARYTREQLAELPAPVRRYFDFALTPGQPLVRHARLLQTGTFALRPDRWAPFTAVEDFAVWPPGFVWDARIRMAPLVTIRVRDSYADGEGAMRGRIAGLVPVVNQGGSAEMAVASLLRWLAEAPWLPTALLPSAEMRWDAVDDSTARATLTDGGTTVSMDVHFGALGEIARISAMRHRDVNGTPMLTPWEGRFRDYARVEGMMVPREGEVGWVLPDGWLPYWRGRIVRAEYRFLAVPTDGVIE